MTSKEMKSDIGEFDKRTNDPVASNVFRWLAKQQMKFIADPQVELSTLAHIIMYEDNPQQTLEHATLCAGRKRVIADITDCKALPYYLSEGASWIDRDNKLMHCARCG